MPPRPHFTHPRHLSRTPIERGPAHMMSHAHHDGLKKYRKPTPTVNRPQTNIDIQYKPSGERPRRTRHHTPPHRAKKKVTSPAWKFEQKSENTRPPGSSCCSFEVRSGCACQKPTTHLHTNRWRESTSQAHTHSLSLYLFCPHLPAPPQTTTAAGGASFPPTPLSFTSSPLRRRSFVCATQT
jgi:hypothetical protein